MSGAGELAGSRTFFIEQLVFMSRGMMETKV